MKVRMRLSRTYALLWFLEIERDQIDVCHRLRPAKRNVERPAGIIARFVRKEVKIKVMKQRKVKRNFSTQNLGFPYAAMPVYINDNLTPMRRNLFAAAHTVKNEKG